MREREIHQKRLGGKKQQLNTQTQTSLIRVTIDLWHFRVCGPERQGAIKLEEASRPSDGQAAALSKESYDYACDGL